MSVATKLWQPENAVAPFQTLELDGVTVIRSCHTQDAAVGGLYLHSHLLLVVVEGALTVEHGIRKIELESGEAVFIRKDFYFNYRKNAASPAQVYQSLLFFIDDTILREFSRARRENFRAPDGDSSTVKIEPDDKLRAFVETVNANFDEQLAAEPEFLRLKMLEILFVLTAVNRDLHGFLQQSNAPNNDDLARLMETNFNQNLPLNRFAQLSRRSLSTFKRDFQTTFGVPPLRWLREKRLDYAHRLLASTDRSVSEICYEAGFENLSHFSRLFKQRYGFQPSNLKKKPHGKTI